MEPIKAELSFDDTFESLSTYELNGALEAVLEEGLDFLEEHGDVPEVTILLTIKR